MMRREQIRELNEANSRLIDARFDAMEAKLDAKLDALRLVMREFKGELIRWMFLFWVGTVASVGGRMVVLQPR